MEEKENENEKIIDIKSTFEAFIEEDKPELSQIDAIKAYKSNDTIGILPKKKKNNNNSDESDEDDDFYEDDEHLKRLKKELIASLERVKELEKLIFAEKNKIKLKKLNVKDKEKVKVKGKNEITIDKMREKLKENEERSREE